MVTKPGTGKSNIVLPTKAKTATIKRNGNTPGSKYGAGSTKGKKG